MTCDKKRVSARDFEYNKLALTVKISFKFV